MIARDAAVAVLGLLVVVDRRARTLSDDLRSRVVGERPGDIVGRARSIVAQARQPADLNKDARINS